MRVVLDTNIFVSSLLTPKGSAALAVEAWRNGRYFLLVAEPQLIELRRTLKKPAIAARIRPHLAGRLINELHGFTVRLDSLPRITRSPDPDDNFLLAMAEIGKADYLVTGDKAGLLLLKRHAGASILTLRAFADLLAPPPALN